MARRKRNRHNRRIPNTIGHIAAVTSVAFAVLVSDVFLVSVRKVHFRSGTDLSVYSDTSNVVTETVMATRGDIYDKDGVTLAEDNHTYNIVCILDSSRPSTDEDHPAYVKDKEGTAKQLSEILGMDYDKVLGYLSQDGVYQTELGNDGRNLSKDTKDAIEALNLPGIEFTDSIQRVYPMGAFAPYIIGYVTQDDDGTYSGKMGFEQILNSYLAGHDGSRTYQTDQYGYVLPGMKESIVSATNGDNVTLTLDADIQQTLEQSFQITKSEFNPDQIWGAVMEADTGRIVAWGQYPEFDPNTLDITEYQNYGSQVAYEPGSTLKTFTWAAAVNEGTYNSDNTAEGYKYCYVSNENNDPVRTYDEASAKAAGYSCVMNYHDESYSNPTLDDGLKYSLNTVAATIQNEYITPEIHLQYLKNFGFFDNVNTDGIPEVAGTLNFTWPADKINLSFGQGSTVTMLQLLQAYSAIMTDGTMKKPYFIDSIRDPYDASKVLYQGETTVAGTPITADTAAKVRSILYKVVNEEGGTGYYYQIPECKVIGKTGTTEVAKNNSYDTDYVISSIMLGLPADNPKYIIYYAFAMDFQTIGTKTEAVTNLERKVAQVFGLSDNSDSSDTTQESTSAAVASGDQIVTSSMPSLINHSLDYANNALSSLGVDTIVLGSGDTVIDQYPSAASSVDTGQRVFLLTDTQSFTMPDLTGWTRKDVAALWAVTGFGFQLSGDGVVTSQSVPAGTTVSKGTEIQVVFG